MIWSFSGYSFCKPHSASYALVSFKSAWLKSHYPAEFMAAVISNQGGFYAPFAYVSEAKRMGLSVMPPSINESDRKYTGRSTRLRIGLMQLAGLSDAGLEELLEDRKKRGPFTSFDDFVRRVRPAPSDAKILVKAGCFDAIEPGASRPELIWRLYRKGQTARLPRGKTGDLFTAGQPAGAPPNPPQYDARTILRHEAEILGFLASRHPLTLYTDQLAKIRHVKGKEIPDYGGKRITTIGWYVTGKVVSTKTRQPMEFVSFEDTTAIYETVFFPRAYRRFCQILSQSRPYVLSGKVEMSFGAASLNVDTVRLL
jgi:error-prone DNA polymerase